MQESHNIKNRENASAHSRAKAPEFLKRSKKLAMLITYGAIIGSGAGIQAQSSAEDPFAPIKDEEQYQRIVEAREQKIIRECGEATFNQVVKLDSIKSKEERKDKLKYGGHLNLQGFETAPTLDVLSTADESAIQIINDAYNYLPEGMRSKTQEILAVRYQKNQPTYVSYIGKKNQFITEADFDRSTKVMHFYGAASLLTALEYEQTEFHELVHNNDWETNRLMTLLERINLFSAVLDRVDSSDRFKSPEVENIQYTDPQELKYRQAKEYLAVIFAQYLENKKLLPLPDRRIVEYYISVMDSNPDKYKTSISPVGLRYLVIRDLLKKTNDPDSFSKNIKPIIDKADKTNTINY